MDVRVMRQCLPPRVQDRDHARLGAKVAWVGADAVDGFGGGLEQDVVDDGLVLQSDRGDGSRHGEDDVEIRNRQQFGASVVEPLQPR